MPSIRSCYRDGDRFKKFPCRRVRIEIDQARVGQVERIDNAPPDRMDVLRDRVSIVEARVLGSAGRGPGLDIVARPPGRVRLLGRVLRHAGRALRHRSRRRGTRLALAIAGSPDRCRRAGARTSGRASPSLRSGLLPVGRPPHHLPFHTTSLVAYATRKEEVITLRDRCF